jgi:acetyl-CoA carboxylase carboxyl transferase subunit beta
MAAAQGIGAAALLADGIVDWVVPEMPDAAEEPAAFCERVSRSLEFFLTELVAQSPGPRLEARLARYRRLGLA